jgi:hypothetical protein
MLDLFQKAMVVCAAVAVFYGGATTLLAGFDQQLSSKVKAISAADKALQIQVDEAVSGHQSK